jgi:hypothetical protein
MKNMAFKVVDRLFIVVYGTGDPTDDEWRHYLKVVEQHGIDRTMQLVFTEGGRPTSSQSGYLNDRVLKGRTVPVAVLSASAGVRARVTALSWFNRKIRAFSPSAIRDALAYLEIPASRTELIGRELDKLRDELGGDRRESA